MEHWFALKQYELDGFRVVVDKTPEMVHPRDLFDDSCWDIDDMCRKIDSYDLDWFILRVRVYLAGVKLGCTSVGGLLYERADQVFEDGVAQDLVQEAIDQARHKLAELRQIELDRVSD